MEYREKVATLQFVSSPEKCGELTQKAWRAHYKIP
jgi:hypothetical protein